MGKSSGGGSASAPNIPSPPAGMIMPQGQTAAGGNPVPSFLPGDPTAMATGLTPAMLQAINGPPPPPVTRNTLAETVAQSPMRNQFGQLSGQEMLMMKMFGQQPKNFDSRAAQNDQLLRIFAGGMGGQSRGGHN